MSDDRNWNEDFNQSKETYKKMKTEDDKKMIEKYASDLVKEECGKWTITFSTKFGSSNVIYFPDSGKWHKEIGKAKGRGAVTMLNYFNPTSREAEGNNNQV